MWLEIKLNFIRNVFNVNIYVIVLQNVDTSVSTATLKRKTNNPMDSNRKTTKNAKLIEDESCFGVSKAVANLLEPINEFRESDDSKCLLNVKREPLWVGITISQQPPHANYLEFSYILISLCNLQEQMGYSSDIKFEVNIVLIYI